MEEPRVQKSKILEAAPNLDELLMEREDPSDIVSMTLTGAEAMALAAIEAPEPILPKALSERADPIKAPPRAERFPANLAVFLRDNPLPKVIACITDTLQPVMPQSLKEREEPRLEQPITDSE